MLPPKPGGKGCKGTGHTGQCGDPGRKQSKAISSRESKDSALAGLPAVPTSSGEEAHVPCSDVCMERNTSVYAEELNVPCVSSPVCSPRSP